MTHAGHVRCKMTYMQITKNLFDTGPEYYLAHCIAADYAMGKGIAVEFQARFNLRPELQQHETAPGDCVLVGRVFNLITKRRSTGKPTYRTLEASLIAMRDIAVRQNITHIAMPLIGCGLDRLQWGRVRVIIQETFQDTPCHIMVCVQPK